MREQSPVPPALLTSIERSTIERRDQLLGAAEYAFDLLRQRFDDGSTVAEHLAAIGGARAELLLAAAIGAEKRGAR